MAREHGTKKPTDRQTQPKLNEHVQTDEKWKAVLCWLERDVGWTSSMQPKLDLGLCA